MNIIKNDKALYTRLEAQKALAYNGEITIKTLCDNINKFPNKQHVILSEKISQKKTYPIARDIPVRILQQIGEPALNQVVQTINCGNENVVKEAIDALGYILYHNKHLNYDDYLIGLFNKYKAHDVILWKVIQAMSSTKSNEVLEFLLKYKTDNKIHRQEIERTLKFISKAVN